MLVLSRKLNERIILTGDIEITIVEISPKDSRRGRSSPRVRLGFRAPDHVKIFRAELMNPVVSSEFEG